jgi:hypothetical protein
MKRLISLVCAAVLVPAMAAAQPKTADDYYKEGETQYNLGNFQGAVDAFKKGFEVEPNDSKKAAYLYNVAQAYRQAKDCGNAQFFYKRYLALKDNDTRKPLRADKRQEIEDRIKELDDCAKQQEAIRNKPPDQNLRPEGDGPTEDPADKVKAADKQISNADDDDGDDDDGGEVTKSAPGTAPTVVSLRAFGGAAKLTTGDLDVPIQATGGLIGGYPLALSDKFVLELGAGLTFTPVPYDSMGSSKTAQLFGIFANVGATIEVAPKFGLRGDLGIGVLAFAGVSESPFTDNQATSGAQTMLHVRVGVSADYALTQNLLATVTPIAFSFSPAKTGLRDDITSITALDFMLGLGYRM